VSIGARLAAVEHSTREADGDTNAVMSARRNHLAAVIDEHEADRPQPAKKRTSADWDRAKELFPSTSYGEQQWVELFDKDPTVMYAILGDIAKVYVATNGPRKTGRRPGVNMSLDQLEKIITPQYSLEPLAESLPALIGEQSLRAFAAKVPVHHHQLRRLMRGEAPVTMPMLESLAKAGRVGPAYFVEWRGMYLAEMLTAIAASRPNVTVRFYKQLARAMDGVGLARNVRSGLT
jgi:hypothetical protein